MITNFLINAILTCSLINWLDEGDLPFIMVVLPWNPIAITQQRDYDQHCIDGVAMVTLVNIYVFKVYLYL